MAYRIEGKDIVIDGFEKGIADSPYQGISDMRCMNIVSVPTEASINFATESDRYGSATVRNITGTGTVGGVATADDEIVFTISDSQTSQMYTGAMIMFSATTIGGLSINTNYWVQRVSNGVMKLYSDYLLTSLVNLTSDGTGTFNVVNMGTPKHSVLSDLSNNLYVLDSNGSVWINNSAGGFRSIGNIVRPKDSGTVKSSNGNGLGFYRSPTISGTTQTGYLFVFRNSSIDVFNETTGAWIYAWKLFTDGTAGGWDYTASELNTPYGTNNPHQCIRGQGNTLYWTDGSFVGSLVQNSPDVAFDPSTPSTYTATKQALGIETNDTATCLAVLGNSLLVGGKLNAIYSWDRLKFYYDFRILLPEENVAQMITVNMSTYILAGSRGRIYYTNGSQASLFKKIPDHLSDTVEPYFTWGGVFSIKNQIYFGVKARPNDTTTTIPNYGGLWAIDVDTGALRITNQLSYGTYANYITCINSLDSSGSGLALYLGYGTDTKFTIPMSGQNITYYLGDIDKPKSEVYSTYIAYVDTDMIPIGTYLQNRTLEQVEFKLSRPMVANEGVKIQYRKYITDTWTDLFTKEYSATAEANSGNMSGLSPVNWDRVQWVQLRVYTKGSTTSPSFVRLKEIRLR